MSGSPTAAVALLTEEEAETPQANPMYPGFVSTTLPGGHTFFVGRLPDSVLLCRADFEHLFALHPQDYHEIAMHGRIVKTPRWQQAYGRDYRYTGRTNAALPVSDELAPYSRWARDLIDGRLNGILVNWYDGGLGHYIGKHRDSRVDLIEGAPIVTISLGDERVFRLRRWKAVGPPVDFAATHGAVFIMPFATNLAWTHEVQRSARHTGRRISITLRAFRTE